MKLLLVYPRGFCAGVVRAVQTVEKALQLYGAPIYVKHEIVHNQHVVNRLKERGAIFIEDLQTVPEGSFLIYSAHGVAPQVRQIARQRKLKEIDATCGLVAKLHWAAKRFAAKGFQIVLIGKKNHVEVMATAAEEPQSTHVVQTVAEVEALPLAATAQVFYMIQTTLSIEDVQGMVAALQKKFKSLQSMPAASVCYATANRQKALLQVIDRAQLVLVIGDQKSSNSNRLKELASKRGIAAYLINNPKEIQPAWLANVQTIALTAGASTPEDVVQKCVSALIELGVQAVEEVRHIDENVIFSLPQELLAYR